MLEPVSRRIDSTVIDGVGLVINTTSVT